MERCDIMSSVSLVKIQESTTDSMRQAIQESLSKINYSFEKEVRSIVIKPNLCYYWDYSTGQTTDPKFIAALINLVREKTSVNDVSIVESDASAMKCEQVFKMLGYRKLSDDYNVNLINLSQDKYDVVDVTAGTKTYHLRVPRTIRNADLRINIPKIKYTMEEIKITCALKNIFGCNPYPKKFRYHPNLGEAIVACNKAMKFDLCLIDGNVASGIAPRRLGLAMASEDPVAIDAAAARIAGVNPKAVSYIRLAEKEGLGKISFVSRGVPLEYFRNRYPRKNVKKILMGKAYATISRLGLGKKLGLE
jgi:uncharacterized protein (DUF362 family)